MGIRTQVVLVISGTEFPSLCPDAGVTGGGVDGACDILRFAYSGVAIRKPYRVS